MRNYVIINGVNSLTIKGLAINELPPIVKAPMRVLQEEIDGRDGDIITDLGYGAYDKIMTIGLYDGYDINEIIAFFNKEGTIVFSDEADKYYNFKIIEQIDYERLIKFRTASITFHCQPFKYPLTETPVEITNEYVEAEGTNITLTPTAEAPISIDLKGNTSQASDPTPDSPVDVNVVSGDNLIEICGKNILDKSSFLSGKRYNSSGQLENGNVNDYYTTKKIYVQPSTTYKGQGTDYWRVCQFDSNDNLVDYHDYSNSTTKPTITTLANTKYLLVSLSGYGGFDNKNIQIEKGDTDTSYTPYVSQTQLISLGVENLYEGSQDFSGTWNNSSYWETDNETYNGLVVKKRDGQWSGLSKNIQVESGKTYTYSLYVKSNSARPFAIYSSGGTATCTPADKNFTSTTNWQRYSMTFVANSTGTLKLRIENTSSNVGNYTYICGYQLEKGSKANSYSPYGTTPIELNKIGNYQDYIYKTDKWYLHKEIEKKILVGTENWVYQQNITRFYMNLTPKPINNGDLFCSHYIKGQTASVNNTCSVASGTGYSQLLVRDERFTTKETFNTWLSSNNVSLYYVLATPTNTEITDSTLISQLEAIKNMTSYDGTTNISQENNDEPFIISAKAMKQGSGTATITNSGNIYSKPTIDIEGTGIVDVYIGANQIFSVNVDEEVIIDSTNLEAYKPDGTLANRNVTGNIANLKLPTGNSTIKVDGDIDKATITNYTRWL